MTTPQAHADLAARAHDLVENSRQALAAQGLNRPTLARLREGLQALAAHPALRDAETFAMNDNGKGKMYRLHEDDDGGGFALYVNVCGSGVVSPPHDHTTWAIIAGVEGVEHNTFYEVGADGKPRETGRKAIGAGDAIALMPDDVHSIDTRDGQRVVCLHFYGLALPRQTGRRAFFEQRDAGHYAPQPDIVGWP